ncbi:MAG: hypothetical protein ACJ78V_17075 [Myxococcales bacterium]
MNPRKFLVPAILSFSFAFAPSLNAVPLLVPSSMTVPIGGIVFGLPESVLFTGTAQIDVKPSEADAPGAVRRVVVSIDLGELTGRGLSTGATYTAGGLTTLMRVLRPHDVIEATIPISIAGSSPTEAVRSAVAQFNFKFNMANGAISAVTASMAASAL